MPDKDMVVSAVAGIVILVVVANSIGWLFDHPTIPLLLFAGIGGGLYWRRRRNTV